MAAVESLPIPPFTLRTLAGVRLAERDTLSAARRLALFALTYRRETLEIVSGDGSVVTRFVRP